MPTADVGAGSGLLALVRYVSGALAIAVAGAVFEQLAAGHLSDAVQTANVDGPDATRARGLIEDIAAGNTVPGGLSPHFRAELEALAQEVLTYAFSWTMLIVAAITLGGTALVWWLLSRRPAAEPATA